MTALGFAGVYHLVFFGLLIPVGAIRSARRLDRVPLPPKRRYFLAVIIQQLVFLGISVAVARRTGIELFPAVALDPGDLILGASLLALAVFTLLPGWRQRVRERERKVYLFMPRDGVELGLWFGIALAAGIGEEVTYRGVMYMLLLRVLGHPLPAVAMAVAAFSVSHWVQGGRSAAIIALFALGFHLVVLATGSLYVAMGVHVLYDATAGVMYRRFGRRYDYPLAPLPAPAEAR